MPEVLEEWRSTKISGAFYTCHKKRRRRVFEPILSLSVVVEHVNEQ
jgi:hypothetical protein